MSSAVRSIENARANALKSKLLEGKILSKHEHEFLIEVMARSEREKAEAEERKKGDEPNPLARPHLTSEHQSRAGRMPRIRLPNGARQANPDESIEEATLRLQQAKADTEELDAQKRELELAALKGSLVPAAAARDNLEAEHLRWVAELEQLPHSVSAALPPEIVASVRDVIRSAIEQQCLAIRQRIAQ